MKLHIIISATLLLLGNGPLALAAAQPSTPGAVPNMAPCMSWRNPRIQPRFGLLCVHGLGLYSRSYEYFGQRMARVGAIVYAIDVRGFGSWMNAKGHKQIDFDGCLQDIQTALESIHKAHPGLPVFILGESMGGAIALRAASMYPDLINGCISAVPAGERFKSGRTDLKVAMQMLTGPRRKRAGIGAAVVKQAATSDPHNGDPSVYNAQLAAAWQDDPLDNLDLSPVDLLQFQRFMNDNHDAVKKLAVPVLFMQGLDDNLVRPDGTWELVKDCSVQDRSMVALPSRHLMFEEGQNNPPAMNKAALTVANAWITARLPDGSADAVADAAPNTISPQTAATLTQGIPTVVAFYAKWCDQCDNINAFTDKAQASTGKRVRFIKLDVDDPNNQALLKEFTIGALPQVVFLKPNGVISSTLIGETNLAVLLRNIGDLLVP